MADNPKIQVTHQFEVLLERAYDKLSIAVSAAGMGFWDWNINTNETYCDEQWMRLLGYAPDEPECSVSFWESLLHPDEKQSVTNTIEEHLNNITPSFKIEHRLRTKQGAYIWVLNTGRVIERDAFKKPIRLSGITIDINEKIITREIIQDSQEKYKSIFEHLNDAYCRFDFSGNILEVNKNLCELLEIRNGDLINNNIKLFFSNQSIKYLHRRLARIIENKSVSFETEIVTPHRKTLPISISARLITSSGDGIIQALIRDITELRSYEKALLDEKQKFKALIEHSPNVISRFGRGLKCHYVSPNILKIMGISPEDCIGKKLSETMMPRNLAKHLEEKMKWVFRKNKEQTVNFSFDSPIGLKHFEAVIVPETNGLAPTETLLVTYADITDKVNREHELNISKLQLEEAENSVHFGTYEIDLATGTLKWSKEMYMLFERDMLLAPPSMDEYYCNYVHPDDYAFTKEQFTKAVENLSNYNIIFRINTSDGKTKHINSIGKLEFNAEGNPSRILGTAIDVTEKKQIENRLSSERDMLQIIMDNIPDAVYFKDNQGRYIRANKGLANLYGFKHPDEFIGKTLYDLYPKDFADEINEAEQTVFASGDPILNHERELPTIHGTIWLSATIVGVKDLSGKVTQIVGISRDITQYKQSEEQLRNAKEKAEQADKLKSAFLANMSHEIRTPINGILGFANLMEIREFERDKQIQYLRIINSSGKLLLSLINDIIDIAKIEAGQINIDSSNVDLHSLFHDLEEFYQGEKIRREKNLIEIRANIPGDHSIRTINTDPFRLRQIINNLISNALKFSDHGTIEFGYRTEGNDLLFFVKDNGVGMSDEETSIIFERFKQAGHQSKKKEGTGLGLAISKGLAELLGGKIWVKSEPGIGSEFCFTIPLKIDIEKPFTEIDGYSQNNLQPEFKWNGKTLLLVEDEEVNYIYINELLENTGIHILHAATAEEAINICKTTEPIDLILMDMRLPGINGFEATRLIKKIRHELPIIAQTAYAMENERKDCYEAGCDHYLTKPFDQVLLFKVLHNFLQYAN